MKCTTYWSVLCIGFLFAACNQEDFTDVPAPEIIGQPEAAVSLKLNIDPAAEGEEATRVAGNKQVPSGYRFRHIVEVFTQASAGSAAPCPIARVERLGGDSYTDDITLDNIRLPKGDDYVAIFWSDFVPNSAVDPAVGYHYNADNLQQVTQNFATESVSAGNADAIDAYAGKLNFTIDANGTAVQALTTTLRRPLTRIALEHFVLEDVDAPNLADIQIAYATPIFCVYNALNGTVVEGAATRQHSRSAFAKDGQNAVCDYVFADAGSPERNYSFTITTGTAQYAKNNQALPVVVSKANQSIKLWGSDANSDGEANDVLNLTIITVAP